MDAKSVWKKTRHQLAMSTQASRPTKRFKSGRSRLTRRIGEVRITGISSLLVSSKNETSAWTPHREKHAKLKSSAGGQREID